MLKDILEESWERRRQESDRPGEGKGGEEESGSGGEGWGKGGWQIFIGKMGRRRVTPRLADDPVRLKIYYIRRAYEFVCYIGIFLS